MGRDDIDPDENQDGARRGRIRLMLKLPAVRTQLQNVKEGSPFGEIFEAYDTACSTLERFRHSLDCRDGVLIEEYETVCAEIEADVVREILRAP